MWEMCRHLLAAHNYGNSIIYKLQHLQTNPNGKKHDLDEIHCDLSLKADRKQSSIKLWTLSLAICNRKELRKV